MRELKVMVIEINSIYQDKRLKGELEYLMIHEVAHFIWRNHKKEFKAFLQSVGVPENYLRRRNPMTESIRTVLSERNLPKLGGKIRAA